jgi:signal transduction histidine kinase
MKILAGLSFCFCLILALPATAQDQTLLIEQFIRLNRSGSYDSAFQVLTEISEVKGGLNAFKESKITNNQDGEFLYYVGLILSKNNLRDSAIIFFDYVTTNEIADTIKHNAFIEKGNTYYFKGDYESALESYLTSIPIAESIGINEDKVTSLNNTGLAYWRLRKYDRAIEVLNESLEIAKKDSTVKLGTTLSHLANVYYDLGKMDEVARLDRMSLAIHLKQGNKFRASIDYNNIGEYLMNYKDSLDKAESYLNEAYRLRTEIGHYHSLISTLVNFATLEQRKGNPEKIEQYLQRALFIADSIKANDQLLRVLPIVRIFEENRGNYKRALAYLDQYVDLRDSLFNEEKSRQIEELIVQYDTERKEIENERLVKESELQKSIIGAQRTTQFLLVFIMILTFAILFFLYRGYKNKQLATLEIRRQNDHLEKLNNAKTRFFSIISHDLRGPMNVMFGFSTLIKNHIETSYNVKEDKKLDEILHYLKNASDQVLTLLDSLMQWAMQEEGIMPNNPERLNIKACLNENIEILTPQAQAKQLTIEADEVSDVQLLADRNSMMAVFRNLISNSLKFTPEGGKIKLSTVEDDNEVQIKVEDNGIGISEEKLEHLFEIDERKVSIGTKGEKGSGLGLKLVADFVRMNKGSIEVSSEVGKGTAFTLRFSKT